jgi:hypothetical protein
MENRLPAASTAFPVYPCQKLRSAVCGKADVGRSRKGNVGLWLCLRVAKHIGQGDGLMLFFNLEKG